MLTRVKRFLARKPAKPEFSAEDYDRQYDLKRQWLESLLGSMHDMGPAFLMSHETRLRAGSLLLVLGALGLGGASVAIVSPSPGVADKVGRHLLAGALANLSLSLLFAIIAAVPLRRGQRWAAWACVLPSSSTGCPSCGSTRRKWTKRAFRARSSPRCRVSWSSPSAS